MKKHMDFKKFLEEDDKLKDFSELKKELIRRTKSKPIKLKELDALLSKSGFEFSGLKEILRKGDKSYKYTSKLRINNKLADDTESYFLYYTLDDKDINKLEILGKGGDGKIADIDVKIVVSYPRI